MWQHYAAIGIWAAFGLAVTAGVTWEAGLWAHVARRRKTRALARAYEASRQPPLGHLVTQPERERHARYRAERPTEAIDLDGHLESARRMLDGPATCACIVPCGIPGCRPLKPAERQP